MKRLAFTAVVAVLIVGFSSLFIVPQGTNAIRYSTLSPEKGQALLNPGAHMKIPLLQKISLIDLRPQLFNADGTTNQPYLSIQTFDKQNLEVGYNVLWQITDAKAFYQAASQYLINNKMREALNRNLTLGLEQLTLTQLLNKNIRQTTINQIADKVNPQLNTLGIKVLAINVSSLNIPSNERQAWLDHMNALQEGQLAQLQLQTSTLAQTLKSNTDNKAAKIIADGKQQADQIRAEANAKATQVYVEAYQKDPEFYEFYHNLQTYQQVLGSKDVLVLGTDNTFFKSLAAVGTSK